MINIFEVAETNRMIEEENLDVRTITIGISLLDCMDSNVDQLCSNIYKKITTIAKEIYGADGVTFAPAAAKQLANLEKLGFGNLPVCMAKTQYSLSDNPDLLGRPTGFEINVREVYVSAGAGFVVAITGSIMTMPGLSKAPAAYIIDVNEDGQIVGLF